MSIVTAEEYYRDSIGFLEEIRDMQKQVFEELGGDLMDGIERIVNSLDKINGTGGKEKQGSSGFMDGIGSSEEIESSVKAINALDVEKAETLIRTTESLSGFKAPSASSIKNVGDFAGGIGDFLETLENIKVGEDVLEQFRIITEITSGLNSLSRSLALNAPFLLIAMPISKLLPFLLGSISDAIVRVDSRVETMDRFPTTMMKLGLGLTIFSAGLAASALIIGFTALKSPESLLMLGIVMGATALAAYAIGLKSTEINKGSLTIGLMALALPVFALGMVTATNMVQEVGFENVAVLGGLIAITALTFGVIGNFLPVIAKGALAVGIMGLGLWAFTSGLDGIGEIVEDLNVLWALPTLIVGLGVVFAAAGAALLFILPGAIAIGAMGLALIPLGLGLEAVMNIPDFGKDKADNFARTLKSVVQGVSELSLTDLLTLPLKLPVIAGMGLALIPFANGINAFQKNASDFSQADADNMEYVIRKTSQAFATAGSTDGMTKLFGFNVGQNDVERGIESSMMIGKNLNTLAKGISAWRDGNFTEGDIEKVGSNITNVMNTIPAVFAAIGLRERGSGNQIKIGGFSFGMPFTKTDTELGISSTMEMGENLAMLHKGIMAWRTGGDNDITPHLDQIVANITNVLTAIPQAFVAVGKMESENERFFGLIDGDLEEGVELVSRMTRPLEHLATILTSFNAQTDAKVIANHFTILMKGIVTSIDMFTDKRTDRLEDLIDLMEDLNEVIEDHFEALKDLPQDSMEKFGMYAESLRTLGEVDINNAIKVMDLQNQNVERTKTINVTELKRETREVERVVNDDDIKKENNEIKIELRELKMLMRQVLSAISGNNSGEDILDYLKSGTIKTEDDQTF